MRGVFNQEATYWGLPTIDGFGTRTFATPVIIKCRWEDRTGLLIEKNGEEINSRAVVYPAVDIVKGGYLALGDFTATENPQDEETAYMIQDYQSIPSVSGKQTLRKAIL